MEEILKAYLKKISDVDYIEIDYYNELGSYCEVKFYTHPERHYSAKINVNVWEIIVFLHEQAKEN